MSRSPDRRWRATASLRAATFAVALLPMLPLQAFELTGRVSLLGTAAWPSRGDAGEGDPGIDTPTADQQSVRLMLDDHADDAEWTVHIKASRQHLRGFAATTRHSSDLFRYRALADDHTSGDGRRRSTRLGWEVDRAGYQRRFGMTSVSVGRQPIDWGSGRLWQPLNVFGAFAPTDLDTDFKPGIDAAVVNVYPSAFSSLTGVYALAPEDDSSIDNSFAVHYRRQVGDTAALALLGGRVIGNDLVGASFESEWQGVGWRVEGLHSSLDGSGEKVTAWIAGLDYQFDNGTLATVEWYDNGRGAVAETGLAALQSDRLVAFGLQQHLGQRLLGVSVQQDLTPLLRAGYTLLATTLRDTKGDRSPSLLHQLDLVYSLGNESDLLLSMSYGTGKGRDETQRPRSEFGHQPASVTLRWRLYF